MRLRTGFAVSPSSLLLLLLCIVVPRFVIPGVCSAARHVLVVSCGFQELRVYTGDRIPGSTRLDSTRPVAASENPPLDVLAVETVEGDGGLDRAQDEFPLLSRLVVAVLKIHSHRLANTMVDAQWARIAKPGRN